MQALILPPNLGPRHSAPKQLPPNQQGRSHLQSRGSAVAIYEESTGACEIFRPQGGTNLNAPVLALWFSGSHYRWVRWGAPGPGLATRLALHQGRADGPDRVPTIITDTVA